MPELISAITRALTLLCILVAVLGAIMSGLTDEYARGAYFLGWAILLVLFEEVRRRA